MSKSRQVVIGVDPHKLSATIEVVDRAGVKLGEGRFASDPLYEQLWTARREKEMRRAINELEF